VRAALNVGRAQLAWHLGATHVARKQWELAFCQYLQAVKTAIAARMPGLALQNFRRAQDVFPRVSHPGDIEVVRTLAETLPIFESEFGPSEGRDSAGIWRKAIRDSAFVLETDMTILAALQPAKGASVELARQGHARRQVLNNPRLRGALNRWRAQKSSIGSLASTRTQVDQEQLLASYEDNISVSWHHRTGEAR